MVIIGHFLLGLKHCLLASALGMAISVCWSVCKLNYCGNIGCHALKFCTDIHGPHWMYPADLGHALTFPPVPTLGLTFVVQMLTTIGWIAMKFATYKYSQSREDKFLWLWWSSDVSSTTIRLNSQQHQVNFCPYLVKYLNIYKVDWHKSLFRHSRSPEWIFILNIISWNFINRHHQVKIFNVASLV